MTAETKALASRLKAAGFRFVGPTTLYALMQACGYVDDHLAGCPVREAVEADRRAAGLG
jgi:DNA-3-methyladenine glycosylase I